MLTLRAEAGEELSCIEPLLLQMGTLRLPLPQRAREALGSRAWSEDEASRLDAVLRQAGLKERALQLERTLAGGVERAPASHDDPEPLPAHPPRPPSSPSSNCSVLKPDAVGAGLEGEITEWICSHDFELIESRHLHLSQASAQQWLRVSWGSSAGDLTRRFFQEMIRFYASGEIVALLLEKEGAISSWRQLLGPGDPSVAKKVAPQTVRAIWGTNKQANAAHGADSYDAARREIEYFFGQNAWKVDHRSISSGLNTVET